MAPTMPPVATSTVLLPPASASATASTSALRRAKGSPAVSAVAGSAAGLSATTDMTHLHRGFAETVAPSSADGETPPSPQRRSALRKRQRARMPDHDIARLARRMGADLPER